MNIIFPHISPYPLIKSIKTDKTAEEIFSLFSEKHNTSFLNSSLETDAGRYSFIGLDPFCVIKTIKEKTEIILDKKNTYNDDPFEILNMIFKKIYVKNTTDLPLISGCIGYFAYDLKDHIEKIPDRAKNDLCLPELYFVMYRSMLIFDKKDQDKVFISVLEITSEGYKKAEDLCRKIKEQITGPSPFRQKEKKLPPVELITDVSKQDYLSSIEKAKEYIRSGDIYQVCLSQRFSVKWPLPPYDLYLRLNKTNPSPFSAYLNFDGFQILSSSPELFLRVHDDHIETRPMKGTRPRGCDPERDMKMKKGLQQSVKDAAELAMIVDLERNDLGKISVPGSVFVSEHRRIEEYPTVFQSISIVKGKLQKETSLPMAVKAVFPGGSISGCPKIRAMEIIEDLEPTKRGIYTGAIGYISFHGTMDLNIAIRTIILKDQQAYYQTGGGITADSIPEIEYEETLHKAKAFFDTIKTV